MGQALRLEVILLSKEKVAAPQPKPRGRPRQASREASRQASREASRQASGFEAGLEAGLEAQGGKQTLQTLNPLQNPPNLPKPSKPSKHLPQQALQGQGHFSIRPPRAKATAMAFYWLSKLPFASPPTLQMLQNPPNAPKPSKHHPKPSKPPGLEAYFEQVAQGLWLVRRVNRRSKTISLPGRLELPTLRLTASRSNQLSYGSLCRRPKLVPVLEKRLNNSWLQVVSQTKGQQPK